MLEESNKIEKEYSQEALRDAVTAWNYAECCFPRIKLELYDILSIHKELMSELRNDIAGKIRTCSVMIGGDIKPYISTALIEEELIAWSRQWWEPRNLSEDDLKQSHVEFEDIHPFEDGNGRTGRILWNLMRLRNGYGIMIIHEGEEQFAYYKWFQKSGMRSKKHMFFDHP